MECDILQIQGKGNSSSEEEQQQEKYLQNIMRRDILRPSFRVYTLLDRQEAQRKSGKSEGRGLTLKATILFQSRPGRKIKLTKNKLTLQVTLKTKPNIVYSKQPLSTNIIA